MVQTAKLKDNPKKVKEPAGVKSLKTYRFIFNCLQACTKWKVKQSKGLKYTNENWLTFSSSSHTITVGKSLTSNLQIFSIPCQSSLNSPITDGFCIALSIKFFHQHGENSVYNKIIIIL